MVTCFGHKGATLLFKTQGETEGTVSKSDLGLFAGGEHQRGKGRIKGDVIQDEKSVIYENKKNENVYIISVRSRAKVTGPKCNEPYGVPNVPLNNQLIWFGYLVSGQPTNHNQALKLLDKKQIRCHHCHILSKYKILSFTNFIDFHYVNV